MAYYEYCELDDESKPNFRKKYVDFFLVLCIIIHISKDYINMQLSGRGMERNYLMLFTHYTELKNISNIQQLKVSSQSRKFEFNVFSIIHLNGHTF